MATTANLNIEIRNGRLDKHNILSGQTIYNGAFVALTTGYIVDATSSIANPHMVGIAKIDGDPQTAGANGSMANGVIAASSNVADVYVSGQAMLAFNTLAATDVGKPALLKDNATLTVSSSETIASGSPIVGYVTKFITSTKGEVDLFGYNSTQLFVLTT